MYLGQTKINILYPDSNFHLLSPVYVNKAVSEFAPTATDTAVTDGVAKDVLYLNTCWRRNLAVAVAIAVTATSNTALVLTVPSFDLQWMDAGATLEESPSYFPLQKTEERPSQPSHPGTLDQKERDKI